MSGGGGGWGRLPRKHSMVVHCLSLGCLYCFLGVITHVFICLRLHPFRMIKYMHFIRLVVVRLFVWCRIVPQLCFIVHENKCLRLHSFRTRRIHVPYSLGCWVVDRLFVLCFIVPQL